MPSISTVCMSRQGSIIASKLRRGKNPKWRRIYCWTQQQLHHHHCNVTTASSLLLRTTSQRKIHNSHTASGDDSFSSDAAWEKLSENTRIMARSLLLEPIKCSIVDKKKDGTIMSALMWKHRMALARAITVTESHQSAQQEQASWLLTYLLHQPVSQIRRQQSFRLGIAGAPGAGKSTFIETLGTYLLNRHDSECTAKQYDDQTVWIPKTLSVVAIDPTSSRSGGSILGDKTRMTALSSGQYGGRCFVRPAPSGAGNLGGLSTFTHDVVTLCQVSGFELVILETVGLGQSEVEVEQAVDMLILLVPPAGGDDLQGVKKGIVEAADLIVITKADGHLLPAAKQTTADYLRAVPFVRSFYDENNMLPGWQQPSVLMASASTGDGIENVWKQVSLFRSQMMSSHRLLEKRRKQDQFWMWKNLQLLVRLQLQEDPTLHLMAHELQEKLDHGQITPRLAAAQLLKCLHSSDDDDDDDDDDDIIT